MILSEIFNKENIILDLESTEKDELFEEMIARMGEIYPSLNKSEAISLLEERESKMTTGVIPGVAIPHAVCSSVSGVCGLIGISKKGIEYESIDGKDVNLVILLLTGTDGLSQHVEILKNIEMLINNPIFIEDLISSESESEVYAKILDAQMKLL